jgi:4-hydroxy-tetrahydrodipicolinate synthase
MVGEFYYLGEEERISHLDAVLEEVNGRLPVVFGCSGVSVPQVLQFARAAQQAGADAIIATAPAGTNTAVAMDMFRRLADAYNGPIIIQNVGAYAVLTGEQIGALIEEVPQIEYVKEERQPGPRHIAEVHQVVGDRVKTIFGGVAGKFMPEELRQGANGCMPACEIADLLAKVMNLWWAGDEAGARALHCRLLPLIVRENQAFIRYMLKRRGVLTSTVERAPSSLNALTSDEKRELSTLIQAIEGDIESYPFGPE